MSQTSDFAGLALWCSSLYSLWGFEHQGLVARDIPVPTAALNEASPRVLIDCVNEHVSWAESQAGFLPGEFSIIAYASAMADSYVVTLADCCHDDMLHLMQWSSAMAKFAPAAFAAMKCEDELLAVSSFINHLDRNRPRAQAHLVDHDSDEEWASELEIFDRMIGSLDPDTREERHAAWLFASGHLVGVEDIVEARRALAGRNALREKRRWRRGAESMIRDIGTLLAVNEVRRRLKSETEPTPTDALLATDRDLSAFEFCGDPVPVVELKGLLGISVDTIVIAPGAGGQPATARLADGEGNEFAREDLSAEEFAACGLGRIYGG